MIQPAVKQLPMDFQWHPPMEPINGNAYINGTIDLNELDRNIGYKYRIELSDSDLAMGAQDRMILVDSIKVTI